MNAHTYKVHPGRMIERDGLPWVTIHKCESCSPSEADDFTREIVRALEANAALLAALKSTLDAYPPSQYRGKHLPPELEQTIRSALALAKEAA